MMRVFVAVLILMGVCFAGAYENKRAMAEQQIFNDCIRGGFPRDACVCVVRKVDFGMGDRLNSFYRGWSPGLYQIYVGEAYRQCGYNVTFGR